MARAPLALSDTAGARSRGQRRAGCRRAGVMPGSARPGALLAHANSQESRQHNRPVPSQADPSRLGLCLDTCHLLAAGYDITSAAGWSETMRQLELVLGLATLRALHINDSLRPLGSRVDRHAHLGRGESGLEGLRCIINDERLAGLPMVIETPKPSEDSDLINLGVLRALWGRCRVGARARALAGRAPMGGGEAAGRALHGWGSGA